VRLRWTPASWPARVGQVLAVYAAVPGSVRLIAGASPGRAVALTVMHVVFRSIEPASLWFAKLLLDALAAQQAATAFLLGGLYVALRVIGTAASWLFEPVYAGFRDRFVFHLHTRLMDKAAEMPDLTLFETPSYYDKLQQARQAVDWAQRLINPVVTGVATVAVFVALIGTIGLLHPLAVAIVLLSALPRYVARVSFGHGYWQVFRGQAPHVRRLDYFFQLLTTDGAAKEVRLFGLGDWLLDRYRRTYRGVIEEVETYRRGQLLPMLGYPSLATIGVGAVLLYAIWEALQGRITISDFVLYSGAVFLVQDALRSVLDNAGNVHDAQLHVSHITEFLTLKSPMAVRRGGRPVPSPWRRGMELRGVTFCYPGTERVVLRDVNFSLKPGETLALVGHNGAGKTTLVKLLCRLYDPTSGEILLDGVDLREYDLAAWRRQVAAIFQDYARYQLTAGENIGLADLTRIDDDQAIAAAAARAGADEVIATLPRGLATPLGRHFVEGVELSIGQWQKLALARAFFRRAPLQILDEPTAALDTQTEYAVYERFRELTRGRTTILISHRFATVRMADRILVLDEGRLVEEGSHAELMAAGRLYAGLYELQAAAFR
jgi:ATP-binding cassette subfamily B protein